MFTTYFQVILREAIHPLSGRSVSKSRFLRAHVHLFEQQSFSSALPSPALSLPHSPALLFTSPPATPVLCNHMPRLLSLFKSRPVPPSSWTMTTPLHQQTLEIPFLSTPTQHTHTYTHRIKSMHIYHFWWITNFDITIINIKISLVVH